MLALFTGASVMNHNQSQKGFQSKLRLKLRFTSACFSDLAHLMGSQPGEAMPHKASVALSRKLTTFIGDPFCMTTKGDGIGRVFIWIMER